MWGNKNTLSKSESLNYTLKAIEINRDPEKLSNFELECGLFLLHGGIEGADLLGVFSSYQERYMLLSDAINKQMKQYAVCNEDFHEIQQEMNRTEERFDEIAPCTQSLEHEDQAEGDQDLHPDFSGNYNLSDDLGIP